jgi:hypothetical protein
MVIRGYILWEKQADGAGGIAGQLLEGNLELVPSHEVLNSIWSFLLSQERLSEVTLVRNVHILSTAWQLGGCKYSIDDETLLPGVSAKSIERTSTESDTAKGHRFVHGTNVTVSDLADDALYHWMAIFLLNGVEYTPLL